MFGVAYLPDDNTFPYVLKVCNGMSNPNLTAQRQYPLSFLLSLMFFFARTLFINHLEPNRRIQTS